MNPFFMQLVVVPVVVIGLGVLLAAITKKIFVGPIVTLILNLLYEILYTQFYLSNSALHITSWNIIFPIISLIVSSGIVFMRKFDPKKI